jgi:hypothetical protein
MSFLRSGAKSAGQNRPGRPGEATAPSFRRDTTHALIVILKVFWHNSWVKASGRAGWAVGVGGLRRFSAGHR